MKALFPSQCPVCHNPIQRGMEIEDSGMRGPRGGKKMAHAECLGGARRNPRRNAGRRTFRGEPKAGRPPRFDDYEADENYLLGLGSKDLARMGTPEALDELERRERGPDGVKLAWKR